MHYLRIYIVGALLSGLILVLAGCTTPVNQFAKLDAVVSEDLSWPRSLNSTAGAIKLESPPQRILTLSVGHDEVVYSLLNGDTQRFAGVSSATHDYSNIGAQIADLPPVGKQLESILSVTPDIVIVDKYTSADQIAAYQSAGLNVFQTSREDEQFNIPNILTLGYLLGLENEAHKLVVRIQERLQKIADLPTSETLRVVVMSGSEYGTWVNGKGTTADAILRAAKAENAASEVDLLNGFVELESLVVFNPDVILITLGGERFKQTLLETSFLQSVPAVREQRIYRVENNYFSTLSHWNICGVEQTARLLYPTLNDDISVCEPFDLD